MTLRPTSVRDVLDLLAAAGPAAALGAAMELGLFPLLAAGPRRAEDLAAALGLGERRCRFWLQLLSETGLIEQGEDGFALSAIGREILLEQQRGETWAFFGRTERENMPIYLDLARRLRQPADEWRDELSLPTDYVARMREDAAWTESFTRMLLDLHGELAERVSRAVDGRGARRLMDLGGGSGVISHALLRANPSLRATIVDIAPVCAVGERVAAEQGLAERMDFQAVTDFTVDTLPGGFDLILECDLSVHEEDLFRRLRHCLAPGGRLLLVDQFAPAPGQAPPERRLWRFQSALLDSDYETPTAAEIGGRLAAAGFRVSTERALDAVWTLLVAEPSTS